MSYSHNTFSGDRTTSACRLTFKPPRCRCELSRFADIVISQSENTAGKAYFRCRVCGFFDWLRDDQVEGLNNNNGFVQRGNIGNNNNNSSRLNDDEGLVRSVSELKELTRELMLLLKVGVVVGAAYAFVKFQGR